MSASTVSLELPTAWVESWLPRPDRLVARRIDGGSGWGLALSAYARQFQPELAAVPPLPAALMVDQLGSLLALATGAEPAAAAPRDAYAMRLRVLDAIREQHAEPGLTARLLAHRLGTSERSLRRCFAGSGTTFALALAHQRLAAARRMLLDQRFDRITVAEIGRRVGLSDASHFVRQCRQHLGATPGALRRAR